MTDLEAIDLRHSRRSYLNAPISMDKITALKEFINQYNHCSQLSIQLVEQGQAAFQGFSLGYGMFRGVQSYFAMIGNEGDVYLKEKVGYYGELLVLEATKLGLGTCWVGGTFNRNHCPCRISEDETLVCLITVGNVAEKKDLKEKTIYHFTHRKTKSLEELYVADSAVPDWFIEGIKAVQKAPSAMNRQPVAFTMKHGIVTAGVSDTKSHQGIDLGIAKVHFELAAGGRFKLGNYAPFVRNTR
jgi:hypothetical protein